MSQKETGGTLVLPLLTIADCPKFFCLLALVERAAGRKVVVLDPTAERTNGAETAALQFGVALHDYLQMPKGYPHHPHRWKAEVVAELPKPVIWVDLDFNDWCGPPLEAKGAVNGIVTLDWVQARAVGQPQPAGRA